MTSFTKQKPSSSTMAPKVDNSTSKKIKTNKSTTPKPAVTAVTSQITTSINSNKFSTQKPALSSSATPRVKQENSSDSDGTTTQKPASSTSKVDYSTTTTKFVEVISQKMPSSSSSSSTTPASSPASSSTSSTTSSPATAAISTSTERPDDDLSKVNYSTDDDDNDEDSEEDEKTESGDKNETQTNHSKENEINKEETVIVMEIKVPNAWKPSFSKKSSSDYRKFMTKLEDQLEKELKEGGQNLKHVEVTELNGVGESSVLASIRVEISNLTISPASNDKQKISLKDALNSTIRDGKVGNLNVDPSYLVFRLPGRLICLIFFFLSFSFV